MRTRPSRPGVMEEARRAAAEDGMSLNQFIATALAGKPREGDEPPEA